MADAIVTGSAAFLNGEGIPVSLGNIEDELAGLWGPTAEREGGPDLDTPTVTRVSLANLVVACPESDAPALRTALDTVLTRHPCRVIVLCLNDSDTRELSAMVSAHCALPAPGMPQVCSERIVLSTGSAGVALLPGAVLPLLEADLPMVLWSIGDPRRYGSLFHDLGSVATRLIPDLPDPCPDLSALRSALDAGTSACAHTRDLAWFGISRWRELVAAFFDPPGAAAALRGLKRVEIVSAAADQGCPSRVGAWLAGWLSGQLGWTLKDVRRAQGNVHAKFNSALGEVQVSLIGRAGENVTRARIERVALHSSATDHRDDDRFELVRLANSEHVRIETCSALRCALGRVVKAPEPDRARRVAAALESSRHDPPYLAALPTMLALIGA